MGSSRRKVMESMTWHGTGVLWMIAGGVPRSTGLVGEATAAEPSGLTFPQVGDSHVGFDKPAATSPFTPPCRPPSRNQRRAQHPRRDR